MPKTRTGKVWPKTWRAYHEATENLCRELELEWPENGLRHSFASYHLAHFRNAAVLALEMGHVSPHVLFAHYREVTTPADAARYWQIVPSAKTAKTIGFSHGWQSDLSKRPEFANHTKEQLADTTCEWLNYFRSRAYRV